MLTLEELHAEQRTTPLLQREGNMVRIKTAVIQLGILPAYKEKHPAFYKKKLSKSSITKHGKIKNPNTISFSRFKAKTGNFLRMQ